MALEDEKCVACKSGTQPLTKDESEKLRQQIPDWKIVDDRIERAYSFPNFVEAMRFANRITKVAEEQNHHPDLHISWGKVTVELSTHKIGGLSQNDFIVAAKIDRLEGAEGSKPSM